jgi:urease accessory protein
MSLPQSDAPPGTGRLLFERVANRTAVVEAFASSPLKFVNPSNHGSAAWVVSGTYGGGLLGGDAIRITVDARANTQAVLMTQASTKVYRSDSSATQTLDCAVGPGALLVSAPDRVACFAGSAFRQTQKYTLAPDANLVIVDWISAGRLESGERWQFDRYCNRMEIWQNGRLRFLDAIALDSTQGSIAEKLRRFNTLATVVILGPQVAKGAAALANAITDGDIEKRADTRIAASPLGDNGIVMRCAGVDVEALGGKLRGALKFVCDIIGDDPWSRW